PEQVKYLKDLKTIAASNARLLYGSDRNRFFDIVVSYDESNGHYGAYLICTIEGTSKALRKDLADSPIKAVQTLVIGLQKDTTLIFTKYDVGDKFIGQQGARNSDGIFKLDDGKQGWKKDPSEAEDDTRGMQREVHGGYGRNGGNGGQGYKRSR
ncbi:hypothetical protein K505DRAFT_194289, partial [Melanomma pulvis-pyrius CBS 109.77]